MQVGVVFPQTEIGSDPLAVRDYAQAAEALGYSHILAFDHVLGANRANRPDFRGPYDHTSLFHEPFVLYGCSFSAFRVNANLMRDERLSSSGSIREK